MNSAERVLRAYLHAKDENRPLHMQHAFAPDAVLEMQVASDNIAFPARSEGLGAITDVLVRRFGERYDNVYTFYLGRPAVETAHFRCDWLVGMTDKEKGEVRVGCGSYDWYFETAEPRCAEKLKIVIAAMEVLPAAQAPTVFQWLLSLPYPWTDAATVLREAPALAGLQPVLGWLRKGAA
ncbi:hypothetical protein GPA19_09795 [Azoarcus indigens]|uniref:SnoaL-like protein n=1 Tax=Azoarcus indigens TaxID=29545 RepID=A0A4R6DSA5_9RHOO|nr:hypothetical protein [Azoarcus indigens]NMG65239.1 hypothetical protein [Azoarcus indigens]TDN47946.1 hypothetical protein C7389_11762 [Azoarcus indigens]